MPTDIKNLDKHIDDRVDDRIVAKHQSETKEWSDLNRETNKKLGQITTSNEELNGLFRKHVEIFAQHSEADSAFQVWTKQEMKERSERSDQIIVLLKDLTEKMENLDKKVKPLDDDRAFKERMGKLAFRIGAMIVGTATVIGIFWKIFFPAKHG